jgi:hypothetical protein
MIDIIKDIIDKNLLSDTRLDNIYYLMHNNIVFKLEGDVVLDEDGDLSIVDIHIQENKKETLYLKWFIHHYHQIEPITESHAKLLLL